MPRNSLQLTSLQTLRSAGAVALLCSTGVAVSVSAFAPPVAFAIVQTANDAQKIVRDAEKLAGKKEYAKAAARYRQAAAAYKAANDAAGQVEALSKAASLIRNFEKDVAGALALYTEALAIARTLDDPRPAAAILGDVARAHILLGRSAEGFAAYQESLAAFEKAQDYRAVAATLTNIALAYEVTGQAELANEYRARAAKVRVEHDVPPPIMRVASGALTERATKRVVPRFPDSAKVAGAQASVGIEVTVATDGTVESARVVFGPPEFAAECLAAAKQFTFEPIRAGGEPARMVGVVTFNFSSR